MKRHVSLHQLSGEHHLGLVQVRRLAEAENADSAKVNEIAREFLSFWGHALAGHFRVEEELLLPYYARRVPPDHSLIVRTLVEHVRMRHRVLEISSRLAHGDDLRADICWMSRFLHDHIRFEERILFPAIEGALSEEELQSLGEAFKAAEIVDPTPHPTVRDA